MEEITYTIPILSNVLSRFDLKQISRSAEILITEFLGWNNPVTELDIVHD